MKISTMLLAGLAAGALAIAAAPANAAVFPGYGNDTNGPEYTITYNADGSVTTTLNTPDQGPYDGSDDTYIGVINNSGSPLTGLGFVTSTTDIFGFDQDGINTYGAPGNLTDTTGYGGPDTYFSNINSSATGGNINFVTPIPDGGATYFSLEEALTINDLPIIPNPVPEPATLGLLGAGLVGLLFGRRRNA